ncbi:energy transducer TonB [Haliea sp. E17]|uniref:energy transducer TonB n=1 Tax=Haliea sp. E17 TaxID=3401576 RepID=UPI003AABEC4D
MPVVLKDVMTFAAACGIGLALFVLMQLMISADAILEKPDGERAFLNFVRVDQSEETRTKERKLNEPPPPEAPPETPDMSMDMANVNPNLSMNMPTIGIPINSGDGPYLGALQQGQGLAGFDTDVIPVVRIAPTYPRGAKQARIEGYVTMAVTIRPDGTVSGAEVIESDPARLFDDAALNAIRRWKFRPKVVDGNPVAQRARQTIEFKLGGG